MPIVETVQHFSQLMLVSPPTWYNIVLGHVEVTHLKCVAMSNHESALVCSVAAGAPLKVHTISYQKGKEKPWVKVIFSSFSRPLFSLTPPTSQSSPVQDLRWSLHLLLCFFDTFLPITIFSMSRTLHISSVSSLLRWRSSSDLTVLWPSSLRIPDPSFRLSNAPLTLAWSWGLIGSWAKDEEDRAAANGGWIPGLGLTWERSSLLLFRSLWHRGSGCLKGFILQEALLMRPCLLWSSRISSNTGKYRKIEKIPFVHRHYYKHRLTLHKLPSHRNCHYGFCFLLPGSVSGPKLVSLSPRAQTSCTGSLVRWRLPRQTKIYQNSVY